MEKKTDKFLLVVFLSSVFQFESLPCSSVGDIAVNKTDKILTSWSYPLGHKRQRINKQTNKQVTK